MGVMDHLLSQAISRTRSPLLIGLTIRGYRAGLSHSLTSPANSHSLARHAVHKLKRGWMDVEVPTLFDLSTYGPT